MKPLLLNLNGFLVVEVLVGAFYKEKAQVGTFSVIVNSSRPLVSSSSKKPVLSVLQQSGSSVPVPHKSGVDTLDTANCCQEAEQETVTSNSSTYDPGPGTQTQGSKTTNDLTLMKAINLL